MADDQCGAKKPRMERVFFSSVVAVGGGLAIWYVLKKLHASSQAQPSVTIERTEKKHAAAIIMQRALRRAGMLAIAARPSKINASDGSATARVATARRNCYGAQTYEQLLDETTSIKAPRSWQVLLPPRCSCLSCADTAVCRM